MAHSYDRYRSDFENLEWSNGLTRDELIMHCITCPPDLLSTIPANRRFYSFQEFWDFLTAPLARGAGESSRPSS